MGGRAVRKDDWKAVLVTSKPSGLSLDKLPLKHWQLYNMTEDPGETTDHSAAFRRTLTRLTTAYDQWAKDVGAIALPHMLEE